MTIGLSPEVQLGPVTLAWHGILTAVALLVALLVAERLATSRGLDPGPMALVAAVAGIAGLVGARLFYLAQEDPGRLLAPWSGGGTGFAFYGSLILGLPAAAAALHLMGRPVLAYLDVAALAFPLAMAVGRVGDLINGEHYGPPTGLPWGVTYTNEASHAPEVGVAYHSGALYEIVMVALLGAVLLAVHRRLRRPGDALWLVLGAYSLGRLVIFFWVRDVPVVGLGLRQAQWTSLALIAVATAGWWLGRRQPRARAERSGETPASA